MNRRQKRDLLHKVHKAVAVCIMCFLSIGTVIAILFILQKLAIEYAYIERGYKAVGGELFLIPVILFATGFVYKIHILIFKISELEDDEDETISLEHSRRISKRRISHRR